MFKSRRARISWKQIVSITLVLGAVGLVWMSLPELGVGLHEVQTKVLALNPILTFVLMALLPICGFSVAVVYVIAGAKFGSGLGLVLVTLATVFHLAGSYWIARSFLRARIEAMLSRRNHHLPKFPQADRAEVALLTALVPGLPYAARNYLLGIAAIPLRTCLWI